MKRTIHHILAIAVITAGALPHVAVAAEKEHHHAAAEKVPGKLADLWKAIDAEHEEIVQFVGSKQFDKLDEPLHHLPPLLAALGKNPEVPADKQKRVSGMANNAIRALEALHHAAHDNKEAEVQARFKAYESVMKALKAQFP